MITLKILAEELKVSVSTVSKALNDSHEISVEVKEKIKNLAKERNYVPNKLAQSLKTRKTKTIGVIIPSILNNFFARIVNNIEQEAVSHGYNIMICLSNESYKKELESIQLLSSSSVDGFVIAISQETQKLQNYDHLEQIQKQDIPLVLFDRNVEAINSDKVIINDFDACHAAVTKLIEKKKKNIAFLSTIHNLDVGQKRLKGYLKAINNTKKEYLLNIDVNTDVTSQVHNFIKRNKKIDAIVSADNVSGTIAINVLKNLKYKIPKHIAVLGFADEEVSNLSVPRLSYISQNEIEIAKTVVLTLIEKINNKTSKPTFKTTEIPYKLVEKESS